MSLYIFTLEFHAIVIQVNFLVPYNQICSVRFFWKDIYGLIMKIFIQLLMQIYSSQCLQDANFGSQTTNNVL